MQFVLIAHRINKFKLTQNVVSNFLFELFLLEFDQYLVICIFSNFQ
jgi:hypothetical protein